MWEIRRSLVDSAHKGPVISKAFPCPDTVMCLVCHDAAIMWSLLLTLAKLSLSGGMKQGAALNLMFKSFSDWLKSIRVLKGHPSHPTFSKQLDILTVTPMTTVERGKMGAVRFYLEVVRYSNCVTISVVCIVSIKTINDKNWPLLPNSKILYISMRTDIWHMVRKWELYVIKLQHD